MKRLETVHPFLWNNPASNNCNTYFIDGPKKILIDPGHAHLFGHVRNQLQKRSLSPGDMDLVLITHGHPDHVEGIEFFIETRTALALSTWERSFNKAFGSSSPAVAPFEPDFLLQEGELFMGDFSWQVFHTPGHSPGSICFYWSEAKALFTGDVVFNQGIGRTDLAGGDGRSLKQSIQRLAELDVEYLFPGHGEIIEGAEAVQANFREIERIWFAYL